MKKDYKLKRDMIKALIACVDSSTDVEYIKDQIINYLSHIEEKNVFYDDWIGEDKQGSLYDEKVICPHCYKQSIGRTYYCPHCGEKLIHN